MPRAPPWPLHSARKRPRHAYTYIQAQAEKFSAASTSSTSAFPASPTSVDDVGDIEHSIAASASSPQAPTHAQNPQSRGHARPLASPTSSSRSRGPSKPRPGSRSRRAPQPHSHPHPGPQSHSHSHSRSQTQARPKRTSHPSPTPSPDVLFFIGRPTAAPFVFNTTHRVSRCNLEWLDTGVLNEGMYYAEKGRVGLSGLVLVAGSEGGGGRGSASASGEGADPVWIGADAGVCGLNKSRAGVRPVGLGEGTVIDVEMDMTASSGRVDTSNAETGALPASSRLPRPHAQAQYPGITSRQHETGRTAETMRNSQSTALPGSSRLRNQILPVVFPAIKGGSAFNKSKVEAQCAGHDWAHAMSLVDEDVNVVEKTREGMGDGRGRGKGKGNGKGNGKGEGEGKEKEKEKELMAEDVDVMMVD